MPGPEAGLCHAGEALRRSDWDWDCDWAGTWDWDDSCDLHWDWGGVWKLICDSCGDACIWVWDGVLH